MRQERITRTKRRRERPVELAPLTVQAHPVDVRHVDEVLDRIEKMLEVA